MALAVFVDAHLPAWGVLTVLVAGLSAAGLAFLFGHHLFRRWWQPRPSQLPVLTKDLCNLGGRGERRRSMRRSDNPTEILVQDSVRLKPAAGVVVNHSEGGLAILVDDCYEAGAVLSLRSPEAEKDIPWVQAKVIQHRKAGKQWLVGCEFVEPPPWNVLVWLT